MSNPIRPKTLNALLYILFTNGIYLKNITPSKDKPRLS